MSGGGEGQGVVLLGTPWNESLESWETGPGQSHAANFQVWNLAGRPSKTFCEGIQVLVTRGAVSSAVERSDSMFGSWRKLPDDGSVFWEDASLHVWLTDVSRFKACKHVHTCTHTHTQPHTHTHTHARTHAHTHTHKHTHTHIHTHKHAHTHIHTYTHTHTHTHTHV